MTQLITSEKSSLAKSMISDRKARNIRVFQDTVAKYSSHPKLKESIAASLKEQEIYFDAEDLFYPDVSDSYSTKVVISGRRSMEAANVYAKDGDKVCVINFASATNPGGGVTKGSNAQEECLCRISTLYATLNTKQCWDAFYGPHRALHNPIDSPVLSATFNKSLYNDDCIYTPNITVFKTDTQEPMLLPEKDWYQVDVITCAAPNLREHPSNSYNPGSGFTKASISNVVLFRICFISSNDNSLAGTNLVIGYSDNAFTPSAETRVICVLA